MKLYEKIMYLRKQQGMSQEDLAFRLDVSRQSVYKWETGMSNPEMDKIKKLSEIFGVSYDALLDDAKDITVLPVSAKPAPRYRTVFDSGRPLPYEHADLDNGYYYPNGYSGKVFTGANKEAPAFFERYDGEMYDAMGNYTKTVRPQGDLCAMFFTDDARGVLGFFYDGAEQFVLPYENIIDVSVTNDEPSMAYDRAPVVGVGMGVGGGVGAMVGSQALPRIVPSTRYALNISYFKADGSTAVYTLKFGCVRMYYIGNAKDPSPREKR